MKKTLGLLLGLSLIPTLAGCEFGSKANLIKEIQETAISMYKSVRKGCDVERVYTVELEKNETYKTDVYGHLKNDDSSINVLSYFTDFVDGELRTREIK